MEVALQSIVGKKRSKYQPPSTDESKALKSAIQELRSALQDALPFLIHNESASQLESSPPKEHAASSVSVTWLLNLCKTVPSEGGLEPMHMARAIVEASHETNEAQQQAFLFDALGASEQAMNVLMEVAPKLPTIRRDISISDIDAISTSMNAPQIAATVTVDLEEERRQLLLKEAIDAAQVAAVAKAELDELDGAGTNGMSTHTIARSSDAKARKFAEKSARRAEQALKRAKEAGAILDDEDLLKIDQTSLGDGGLLHRSDDALRELQQSLLPEGSRQYYDQRGLPKDAIREQIGDIERVIIPAPLLNKESLPPRLKIQDIMDVQCAKAFAGTESLNPMQSQTFQVAFHSRDNMMVCAPTGAGKTNVAMLTVASHFRDVGLIGSEEARILETGKKAVYIAPMKALAQEVVEKFSAKLKPLGLIVRELTGDMQLTRAEAESANIIVTTPEKWDVVTRKSGNDENSLGNQCGLLIIDEVHLLADERGAVIESVVARLHRLVESRQRQVRMVALSATLPNYDDVAEFLQVPDRGVFYFGPEHRPVPLQQTFIGINVNVKDRRLKEKRMNEICFDEVLDALKRGYQVMVFVHSRKGTGETASALAELAIEEDVLEQHFVTQGKDGSNGDAHRRYADRAKKSRNREVSTHFENGIGIHHAGMLRGDRKLTEQMFNDGAIKVLCCTATLAWGINLPAHSVVIKGTEIYNPEKGGIVDLSILDVQQIFGRAGRPQFDSSGEATLITTGEAFPRYMDKLVRPIPIESNFVKQLADHLNAEVVGGTVSTLKEAARWLTYTYLYVRMLRNPLAYGIGDDEKAEDPMLRKKCMDLVTDAAKLLDATRMIRANNAAGNLSAIDKGRVAANFYIQAESISTFNDMLRADLSDAALCRTVCSAEEFCNMKLRPDEMDELQDLSRTACPFAIQGAGKDDKNIALVTGSVDKAFVLMQVYISKARVRSFTLISDTNYIASNAGRVTRALFEICLRNRDAGAAAKLLRIAKSVEQQVWWFKSPLRQFGDEFKESIYSAVEGKSKGRSWASFDNVLSLLDMQPDEVAQIAKCSKAGGAKIQRIIRMLPNLEVHYQVKPVTAGVLRFHVDLRVSFEWVGRWHGGAQSFWLWIENQNRILHHEHFVISWKTNKDPIVLDFSIPVFESATEQYCIRLVSDSWVGVEQVVPISVDDINIPVEKTISTPLFDLTPLPTSALNNPKYEQLYTKFKTFNPIQTQLFHVLYHTDTPVLLGAPTGSGKTAVAELAILRMKSLAPKGICVYIAPLKALARERLKEWKLRLGSPPLSWSVLELSGDTHHDLGVVEKADILVCTPEKWDLISRGWRGSAGKGFIKRVRLLVMDEVHLLGEERGAVLEAIVSRTRFISRFMQQQVKGAEAKNSGVQGELTRIIGLSTNLANPQDLADWMGINTTSLGPTALRGLYNFRPSVRPVPTKIHIQGYTGKHYCPRMATMNRPCFAAIKELSPTKPTLIFVASRRQTRLTAFDIISYAAGDETPGRFLKCSEDYVEAMIDGIKDESLRHTLSFGIGLHHAGLASSDREVVEKLFLQGHIMVLVATATLAWGVNLPAHMVIVKGTEFFDGKTNRYVDYPLTDVLQMIGRAGRPGFDTDAVAVVMVAEDKKSFYKKFLYSPFPVESCLDQRLNENLNAEIASGTIGSLVEAVGYLSWTFYARRVKRNPAYYGAKSGEGNDVEGHLFTVAKRSIDDLLKVGCVRVEGEGDDVDIASTVLGLAGSQFYLSHRTPQHFEVGLREVRKLIAQFGGDQKASKASDESCKSGEICGLSPFDPPQRLDEISIAWILFTVSTSSEFDELPVRHNEEFLNEELSDELMWGPDTADLLAEVDGHTPYRSMDIFEDPHTKCFLLIQAYLEYAPLPISDYVNDTKSVVENLPRLLAAIAFVAAGEKDVAGSFDVLTQCVRTRQLVETRSKVLDSPLVQIPGIDNDSSSKVSTKDLRSLRSLDRKQASSLLQKAMKKNQQAKSLESALQYLYSLPKLTVTQTSISSVSEKSGGQLTGKLQVDVELDRTKGRSNKNKDLSLTLLLGTFNQKFLLAESSARIGRFGKWTVSRTLTFDWDAAKADGNQLLLRVLVDEVRGLDMEYTIRLL